LYQPRIVFEETRAAVLWAILAWPKQQSCGTNHSGTQLMMAPQLVFDYPGHSNVVPKSN
jgi:hypothetical protein